MRNFEDPPASNVHASPDRSAICSTAATASKFLTETGAMSFDLERARRDTPACARHAHLNNAGASLLPAPVVDAVRAHLDLEVELGGYEAAHDAATAVDRVRSSVAALVGAEAAEIAFADSATRAWISAFTAIRFRPGDRILTSSSEYASNVIALLQAAEHDGVTVDVVANDETGALSLPDLERLMDERVRLVAVTHVPTSSGLVNDVAGVGAIVAGSDALFLVDACQSVGQLPIDVDGHRVPPAVGDRPQVPARAARHRLPLRRRHAPRRAGADRRRPALGALDRSGDVRAGRRRDALRAVGAQRGERPRSRRRSRLRAGVGCRRRRTAASRLLPPTCASGWPPLRVSRCVTSAPSAAASSRSPSPDTRRRP